MSRIANLLIEINLMTSVVVFHSAIKITLMIITLSKQDDF